MTEQRPRPIKLLSSLSYETLTEAVPDYQRAASARYLYPAFRLIPVASSNFPLSYLIYEFNDPFALVPESELAAFFHTYSVKKFRAASAPTRSIDLDLDLSNFTI